MSRPRVLYLGKALVEFMRPPDGGDRVLYEQSFGSDTSNAAIAAARHGARVGNVFAVGDDPFGAAWRDLCLREGVSHTHVIARPGHPTGACLLQPHASGRHFSYARRGSAASFYSA